MLRECEDRRMTWPRAALIRTPHFVLEPLSVEHADEMAVVLAPVELYAFTGGEPPTAEVLRARYARQVVGRSPSDDAGWLNWVVRAQGSGRAVGYVQATLTHDEGALAAEVAWLVAPSAQQRGVATEAATAMLEWLRGERVQRVRASIHPDHHASARVAERLGLAPTGRFDDGEQVWEARSAVRPV